MGSDVFDSDILIAGRPPLLPAIRLKTEINNVWINHTLYFRHICPKKEGFQVTSFKMGLGSPHQP